MARDAKLERIASLALTMVLVCTTAARGAQTSMPFEGQRLEDALRDLQRAGLRIVFSSEIVAPTMRVPSRPRVKIRAQFWMRSSRRMDRQSNPVRAQFFRLFAQALPQNRFLRNAPVLDRRNQMVKMS